MAHVSRKKLKKHISHKIYMQLVKTISSGSMKHKEEILRELLTQTEQVMLAKRLAAVAMLAQGVSSYRVWRILGLSSATTRRFQREMDNGSYRSIAGLIKKKKDRERFWAEMEALLRMGMPEMGKGRWKWLDEIYPKE